MHRIRFSDEWMEKVGDWGYENAEMIERYYKVKDWADENAVMIKRYDAFLGYRRMQAIAEKLEFNQCEMERFYSLNNGLLDGTVENIKGDGPGEDTDSDDWPD